MGLILGMDIWVFTAWLGSILAAILCVLYGLYHEYLKKMLKRKKEED
jgi:predicted outer membrane lipoprotein